jgi:hypothetical protein
MNSFILQCSSGGQLLVKPTVQASQGHHRREQTASGPHTPRPRGRHRGCTRHQQFTLQRHCPLVSIQSNRYTLGNNMTFIFSSQLTGRDTCTLQARHIPARVTVGGRAGDGDTVPNQAKHAVHLQVQRNRAGRHALVART